MRVQCKLVEVSLKRDGDRTVRGVRVECSRCLHSTESYGTGEGSVKRGP
jgi:hypothetical protein